MENIYIKAMEIGFNNPSGIEYPLIKEQVEKHIGNELNQVSETGFMEWFLDSFTSTQSYPPDQIVHAVRTNNLTDNWFIKFLKDTWVIKGKTTKQYIDYLELKESREQSKRAFNTSLWSIGIALFALASSILFSWYLSSNAPQPAAPPFDVKIIEDKTSTPKLEKKVKDLEEKLYEAEMLIEVYEEEKA